MSFQRSILGAVALLGLVLTASAEAAPPVPTHSIAANVNDARIDTSRGANLIWLTADPARRVGKLLVFLPSGGATNLPTEFLEFGNDARTLGYHTIVLAYKNEAPIAALPPAGCGTSVEASGAPTDCAILARKELLDGKGESTVVNVDEGNSIENRLNKVLEHLATTYPAEGWAQFIEGGKPKWSDTVISGASLGAGEAVLMGERYPLSRVVLLHGWTDAKHGWVALGATPPSRYFALIHARDNFYGRTCYAYVALSLATACPLDKPVVVDTREPPFGSPLLVLNLDPTPNPISVTDPWHSSTTRDGWIAREPDGSPSRRLLNAWRSTLGDSDADTYLDQADNCPTVANTDQADADGNRIGDACSTFKQGTVGGSVPATLALTLGPAASFGAFTPGVDRNYEASTTATVVSSAGDAALSASDPSTNATGRLVNGAFSLAEALQARAGAGGFAALGTPLVTYAAPVSNDVVTVTFRQHIGASQALRTGAYSKTLTFTLSTTMP